MKKFELDVYSIAYEIDVPGLGKGFHVIRVVVSRGVNPLLMAQSELPAGTKMIGIEKLDSVTVDELGEVVDGEEA